MKIIIGSDGSGLNLKEHVKSHLQKRGEEIIDLGMFTGGEQIPFYEIAASVARKVQDGEAERAILCCGTGMGVAIVANKFKGVYAGVVESEFGGRHCKVINNCNVLTMGAWVVPPYQATRIVDLYLDSPFTKGYEGIRGFLENACIEVGKIENETMK